jgi:protein-tyrosine phosphatase
VGFQLSGLSSCSCPSLVLLLFLLPLNHSGNSCYLSVLTGHPSFVQNPIRYLRIPIEDAFHQPILDYLPESTELLLENHSKDIRTLVHCERGASRSATVVAGYLLKLHPEWTVNDTITRMQRSRIVVRPNEYFRAVLQEWRRGHEEVGNGIGNGHIGNGTK